MGATGSSVLEDLVSRAIRLGADALDVEYSYGKEQVFAVRGSMGVGSATFPSSSPEAKKVARMLKAHLPNILTYLKHRITNALTGLTPYD